MVNKSKQINVLHISSSNDSGGAARAAHRIYMSQKKAGMDSRFLVDRTSSGGTGVFTLAQTVSRALRSFVSPIITALVAALQRPINPVLHSAAVFSSVSTKQINSQPADIVNLHWINGGMLSILAISRIKKPVIWTLHDTWAFSGAEHYDAGIERWKDRYSKKSRPRQDRGLDIDRLSWILKSLLWRKGFGIVAPSEWMRDCVKSSSLMANWPVRVIPYPIDSKAWRPIQKDMAREVLGLRIENPIVLFGAIGGTKDPRKGFDLFQSSIPAILERIPGVQFLIFGDKPVRDEFANLPMTFLGVLHDDLTLRLAYSAADVFIITSRQDNLPNTGIEAQACGTPVVAFEVGGLPDVVEHLSTGYLAKPFDLEDLAAGVDWAFREVQAGQIGPRCRERAETVFSEERISEMYSEFYAEAIRAQSPRFKKNLGKLGT